MRLIPKMDGTVAINSESKFERSMCLNNGVRKLHFLWRQFEKLLKVPYANTRQYCVRIRRWGAEWPSFKIMELAWLALRRDAIHLKAVTPIGFLESFTLSKYLEASSARVIKCSWQN